VSFRSAYQGAAPVFTLSGKDFRRQLRSLSRGQCEITATAIRACRAFASTGRG